MNKVPSLFELQDWMRWVITDPRGVSSAIEDPGLLEPKPSCLDSIAAEQPLGRDARLDIYAEAYFTRLSGSLSKDFESLRTVLGNDAFRKLIADYLKKHPSRYPSVAEVGRSMSEFLAAHPFSKDAPYLTDLALLEWLMIEAFYSDHLPALDTTALADVSEEKWDKAKVTLDSTVKLMATSWPVNEIWITRDQQDQGISTEIDAVERRYFLIFRSANQVELQVLSDAQWTVLQSLRSGKLLHEVMEALWEQGGEPAAIMQWFSDWVSQGVIRKIEFP